MRGVEAYIITAVVLTAVGFWRERPGWFALSALLALMTIYASAFVMAGCAWTGSEWTCHYVNRPDLLVGALVVFFFDMFGLYVYIIKDVVRYGMKVIRRE